MKNEENPQNGLKSIRSYLPDALKFFELGKEYLTPALFTLILLVSFSGNFVGGPGQEAGVGMFIVYLASVVLVQLAYAVYLYAFLKDRKGEAYTIGECVSAAVRNASSIVIAFILSTVLTFLGLLAFIIPGIIISIMLMFGTCFIVDRGMPVSYAFARSREVTSGRKWEIFGLYLIFYLILFIPMILVMFFVLSAGNSLILAFVLSFAGTLVNLMTLRMTALLYLDLAYPASAEKKDGE